MRTSYKMERMFVNETNVPILSLLLLIGGLATIQIPWQKWSITIKLDLRNINVLLSYGNVSTYL